MKYRNAIIIEGPDCSGKTTLAKNLNDYFNNELDIIHCTGHDPKDFEFYKQLMRKKNVVFDRHFVGETVYPVVFNRTPQLSIEEYNQLATFAEENRIPVIILAPPVEVLTSRLNKERPNEEVEVVNTIVWARNEFYKAAENNKYFILSSEENGIPDLESIIERIKNIWGE